MIRQNPRAHIASVLHINSAVISHHEPLLEDVSRHTRLNGTILKNIPGSIDYIYRTFTIIPENLDRYK